MATKNTVLLRAIQPRPRVAYLVPPSGRPRKTRRRRQKLIATRGVPPWKARKFL